MAKSLYFISAVSSFCWLMLFIYQIPPFLEANDYVSVYRRKEFVIEAVKLLTYAIGIITYLILGCYRSCFDCMQRNFVVKFCTISLSLTLMLAFDGLANDRPHYITFAAVNLCCTVFVYKEIVREWEEEMRKAIFIDDSKSYEKISECESVTTEK